MRVGYFLVFFVVLVEIVVAQQPRFDNFYYQGKDLCFAKPLDDNQRYNPILSGFYPDPSICRKGNDYYMVNSSFSYFPGIPLFHSTNLMDWEQIGHVLDREEQVSFDGLPLSGGVYAPAISYNKFNDTFYVINTIVGGIGNYLVKSKRPEEGWSNPIKLPKVKGIDPSLFYDDDGKVYIVSSYLPKESKWYGHRSIHLYEYDYVNDSVIGNSMIVVDGGVNPQTKPQWLEGPHIYKVNGLYYMIMAEGGTHAGHREVAFWSKNVKGPYEPCPINPILSQLDLSEDRSDKVINVGHADLIDTPDGDWYAVFLGCRPYQDKLYNTGRETFLLPVTWEYNTPIILKLGKAVPPVLEFNQRSVPCNTTFQTGNYEWHDSFESSELDMKWNAIRSMKGNWYKLKEGVLELTLSPNVLKPQLPVHFIGRRQQHLVFKSSVELDFSPNTSKEYAGIVLLQNENFYVTMGITRDASGNKVLVARNYKDGEAQTLATSIVNESSKVKLIIDVQNNVCDFSYEKGGGKIIPLVKGFDITHLSTEIAKGFVGCYVGMYATSNFEVVAD